MKKFLIGIMLFLSICFSTVEYSFAECKYNSGSSFQDNAKNCFNWNSTVVSVDNANVSWGFKDKLSGWIENLAVVLWVFAVGWIVYGGLSLTLSTWDDEKIKKAKDMIKWSMLWFIGIVLATTIVTVVINLMYSIWSVAG